METEAKTNRESYAERGVRALHRAVRAELEKKSKLGQYVIIWHDGKAVRIPASEALASLSSK